MSDQSDGAVKIKAICPVSGLPRLVVQGQLVVAFAVVEHGELGDVVLPVYLEDSGFLLVAEVGDGVEVGS